MTALNIGGRTDQYTPDELAGIVAEAWEQFAPLPDARTYPTTATCPRNDGGVVRLTVTPLAGTELRYTLGGSCLECERLVWTGRDRDPAAGHFHPWTDTERTALVTAIVGECEVRCPCDGSRLVTNIERTEQSMAEANFLCWRCGNRHVGSVPRETRV